MSTQTAIITREMVKSSPVPEAATKSIKAEIKTNTPFNKYDFEPAREPEVSWWQACRFFVWAILLMLSQLWSDIKERHNGFRSFFTADLLSHFFYVPVGRFTPRIVVQAPTEHMKVRVIPKGTTRRYEELEDLDKFPVKDLINCASSNYAGFARLDDATEKLIEKTISKLPFTDGNAELESIVRADVMKFMGFEACELSPSGFSGNLLAFRTVYNLAQSYGKKCIFLCDRDCHNSMFTGAYNSKNASTRKFDHNDIGDLELKLRELKQKEPDAFVCVAVEGIYSMEGTSAPIPAIVALKKVYGFKLLVDEAHSLLAIGSAGRGSFNYWQDLGYDVSLQDVDIMSCTFSKSVGCLGGMALANRDFAVRLTHEAEVVRARNSERLSATIMVRLLAIIRKPLLVRRRMEMVRAKAAYAAHFLSKAGCKVLSSPGSPVVCFPIGTVQNCVMLHDEGFKRGVAFGCGMPPATPVWGCRVRMCIFATLEWTDLYKALTIINDVCVQAKIPGVKKVNIGPNTLLTDPVPSDIEAHATTTVNQEMGEMIDTLAVKAPRNRNKIGSHPEVVGAGLMALKKYGVGPCSARWYYGSFDVFIKLEQRLASLYPSLIRHAGKCRGMVCSDAEVTIGSSFAARASVPRDKTVDNLVLVPRAAPHFVHEGVNLAKPSKTRRVLHFGSLQEVPRMLAHERRETQRTAFLTIYLEVVDKAGSPLDIIPLLRAISQLNKTQLAGACLYLDDRNGLGKIGPNKLGYLNYMECLHGDDFIVRSLGKRSADVQVLVAGSWVTAFGLQGGYVAGDAAIVENLTWDTRAYFFSTPPMPLQTVMSDKALELLGKGVF